jgi:hypothetical protein
MAELKRLVNLTDDNWADYFPFDYHESFVAGMEIPDDGFDPESKVVTRLLAWIAMRSGESSEFQFEISRHDAAVVLNLAAGWPPY